MMTEENAEEFSKIVDDPNRNIDQVVEDFDKTLNKIKYSAFGKTTLRKKSFISANVILKPEELMQKQTDRVEKEINELKKMNQPKSTQMFKIAERIRGAKGASQEPTAVKDPKTNEIVVSTQAIKSVVLDYCTDVLRNNDPKEEFEKEIKVKELIHDMRSKDKSVGGSMIQYESFEKVLEKIKK